MKHGLCAHCGNVTSSKNQTRKNIWQTKKTKIPISEAASEIRMMSVKEVVNQRTPKKSNVHSSSELCCQLGVNIL